MTRWCVTGRHAVPDHEAQVVDSIETGSGPSVSVYACHVHIRDEGIVPRAYIGRPDAAPIPPTGRPA